MPTAFVATAMSREMSNLSSCAKNPLCDPAPPVRMRILIAWDKGNPKRVVQFSSVAGSDPIAAMLYPSLLAIYSPMASLVYMDGAGGTFFGTSGMQQVSAIKSATPCGAGRDSTLAIKPPASCVLADFTTAFDGNLERSAILVRDNTAKGAHTIAMAFTEGVGHPHAVRVSIVRHDVHPRRTDAARRADRAPCGGASFCGAADVADGYA